MNEYDRTSELIAAGTTAVSSFTSIPIPLNGLTRYSVQLDFSSGSCTGSWGLSYSNTDVNYVVDPDSIIYVTAGGSHLLNVVNASYKYVKLNWTPTSGAGTMAATLEIKGVQG